MAYSSSTYGLIGLNRGLSNWVKAGIVRNQSLQISVLEAKTRPYDLAEIPLIVSIAIFPQTHVFTWDAEKVGPSPPSSGEIPTIQVRNCLKGKTEAR